jgi:hypothetical protein
VPPRRAKPRRRRWRRGTRRARLHSVDALAYRCHSSRTYPPVPEGAFRLRDANHERRDDADLPLRVVHLHDVGAAAATPAAGGGVASSHSRG